MFGQDQRTLIRRAKHIMWIPGHRVRTIAINRTKKPAIKEN